MSKIYNFLFGYSQKKLKAIVVLQLIGLITLVIIEEVTNGVFMDIFWDLCRSELLGVVVAVLLAIIVGCINGFFINIIANIIELLESSASSLKALKEKSESNNTDNT